MRVASLVLVASWGLLAGCRSEPHLSPGDFAAVDVPPDTAQHSALPDPRETGIDPYAMVPGVRVGQVRLGMPFDSVLVALGQPPRSDAGRGTVWGAWPGWGAARDAWVDVFATADSPESPYLVAQIRIDGPPFYLKGDPLRVDATRADVLRLHPSAKTFGTDDLYDDRQGIAFAFDSAADSARATAVLIVLPGTPANRIQNRPDTP